MTDLLLELYEAAMEQTPYRRYPARDKAEAALEEFLGEEHSALLRDYNEAVFAREWEEGKALFYRALALGMELGTLKPY